MPESTKLVKMDVKTIQAQKNSMLELLQKSMQEGLDYGVIPGTTGKSLFAAGADKLAKFFHLYPDYETQAAIEHFDEKPFFYYRVKCVLLDDEGSVRGSAIKIAHTKELGYRKLDNSQILNKANSVLSMAEKRAFVGAVKSASLAREIFKESFDIDETTGEILTMDDADDDEKHQTMKRLFATAAERGFEPEQVKSLAKRKWSVDSMNDLTISHLQKLAEYFLTTWREVGRGKPRVKLTQETADTLEPSIETNETTVEVFGETDMSTDQIKELVDKPIQGEVVKDASLRKGETVKPEPTALTCTKCKKTFKTEEMANKMFCKTCKSTIGKEVEAEEVV